ncbi:MAG: hypothetical protein AAF480_12835 [Actinomycetota bacterium]
MDANLVIEAVGYLGSGLIVLSITQRSILRLRLLGLAGSLTFLAYALSIGAYPIAVVNVIVASIHVWYLRKLVARKSEVFRVLHVPADSRYLLDFLDFYRDDIQGQFQPEFEYTADDRQLTAFILRDMVPAGLFIGRTGADGSFEVELDFVIPQYRDFKVAGYVYSQHSGLFDDDCPPLVWTDASNAEHATYLKRVGFTECPDRADRYEIHIDTALAA